MKTKESSYIFCINILINSQTKNEFRLKKEFCEICEISKNTFLQNTSGQLLLHQVNLIQFTNKFNLTMFSNFVKKLSIHSQFLCNLVQKFFLQNTFVFKPLIRLLFFYKILFNLRRHKRHLNSSTKISFKIFLIYAFGENSINRVLGRKPSFEPFFKTKVYSLFFFLD